MSQPFPGPSGDPLRRATPPPARHARPDDGALDPRRVARRAATLLVVAVAVAAVALIERALAGPAAAPLPLWLVVLATVGAVGVGVALRHLDAATARGRGAAGDSPRRRAAAQGWRTLETVPREHADDHRRPARGHAVPHAANRRPTRGA